MKKQCLDVVGRRLKEGTILGDKPGRVGAIYTFVENSGRLDQILANIQSLILGINYLKNRNGILFNEKFKLGRSEDKARFGERLDPSTRLDVKIFDVMGFSSIQ